MPAKQKGAQAKILSKASASNASVTATARPKQQQPAVGNTAGDGISMLKQDHRKVDTLFTQYESDGADKASIRRQICNELIVHTMLEEEVFYPACRDHADEAEDKLDEAQVEHDSAKMLIIELLEAADDDAYLDAKVKVLAEQVRMHVKEEEAADGIFAKAQAAGINNPDLARRLRERKSALQMQAQSDDLPEPQVVSFQHAFGSEETEEDMSRGNYSGRDDRGRFTGDDDRGYGRSQGRGSSSSRSRYDDDDDRRYGRSGGNGGSGWYGDSEGHAEAARRGWESRDDNAYRGRGRDDDDDRRYSSRGRDDEGRFTSRARDDDDYRRSSRSSGDRGQGGWFGDPEGHSEASRRGWDDRDRGGYSSRGRDDDDYRRSSRSSSGGRSQGGWFGDPEGHSEASRRGWEDRDRGSSRSRGRDDDDDRRYARSRDDDDDGRGHGRGGWFGDPEGHSEASRRGWDHRR